MKPLAPTVRCPQRGFVQAKAVAPPVYHPGAAAAAQMRPATPAVYRPQHGSLQRKLVAPPVYRALVAAAFHKPAVYRPQVPAPQMKAAPSSVHRPAASTSHMKVPVPVVTPARVGSRFLPGPRVVQRTVLKEVYEDDVYYRSSRMLAAQHEIDNSADYLATRHGMQVKILGSMKTIEPGEHVYVVGHQMQPGTFTHYKAPELLDQLKAQGMTAATRVTLVGCNTKKTHIFTLLSEFLTTPPDTHDEVLLVTPTTETQVPFSFVTTYFEGRKGQLGAMTATLVDEMKAVVDDLREWVSDDTEPLFKYFVRSLPTVDTLVKATNLDALKQNNPTARVGALRRCLNDIKQKIATTGNDNRNLGNLIRGMEAYDAGRMSFPVDMVLSPAGVQAQEHLMAACGYVSTLHSKHYVEASKYQDDYQQTVLSDWDRAQT